MVLKLSYRNIFDYLDSLKIDSLEALNLAKVDKKRTFDHYWTFELINETILTVKQLFYYHKSEANYSSLTKEYDFLEFSQKNNHLSEINSLLPTLVNFDQDNLILAYQYSNVYTSLKTFYDDQNIFPDFLASQLGKTIAKLHYQSHQSSEYSYFFKNNKLYSHIPYPNYLLDRIEIDNLAYFSAETLNFIAFYQRYESLKLAIRELMMNHDRCCLTHNNLQFNKILLSYSINNSDDDSISLKLVDWEKCSWGDPAFDVGTIIAGYLNIWLESLIVNPAINLEESLKLATIPLEILQPSLKTFLKTYLQIYSTILPNSSQFIQRIIQFSGLVLIYQIIANIQSSHLFNGLDICRFQVAKNLLCKPSQSFQSILGMTESELIN